MGSHVAVEALPSLLAERIDVFACPACAGGLRASDDRLGLQCLSCNRYFGSEAGIPLLFWPNEWSDDQGDVTDAIRAFYEETPFPNYDDLDSSWSLRQKAEKGVFARLLDEQIAHGAMILEVGCGTGQLSNFLGMRWGRAVFGTDICLNSLKLGQDFRQRNQISGVAFLQMNLFRPVFKADSFDLVICNGVLHHTSDPFRGFRSISGLVKKGGFLIVGLYNTYGRMPTDIRRVLFKATKGRFTALDPRMRDRSLGEVRKRTWFADQYLNPHESKHTIGEVLRWFEQSGIQYVSSIPKCRAFDRFSPEERLFEVGDRGTRFDHFLVQSGMLLGGGREGGFFMMIGRRQG